MVWLRLGAGAASSRPGFGGERYETAPFQAAVAHAYDALSEGWWSRVDAGGAAEEVAARVWAAAAPAVAAAAAGAPLRRLWDGSGGDDGGGGGAR